MNIEECINRGFLKRSKPDHELSAKELKEARYDLDKANTAFSEEDFKWCIIKCYYSMFHAAKAALFVEGYIEKKHVAIIVVLEDLSKKGKLSSEHIIGFKGAMSAREQADYQYSYSKEVAEFELNAARKFIGAMKDFITKA